MEIWAIKNQKENPMEMLQIGEFDNRIDKELLAMKIAQVCGAMTPVHNTTGSYLEFHKLFFKMWSTQISRLLDTLEYEYEPLENYRRVEKLKHTAGEVTDVTDNTKGNFKGKTTDVRSSTNEQKTSAYNEDLYQPENINELTGNDLEENENNTTTDRTSNRKRDLNTTDENTIRGLNGLFTTQQLLQQEREVAQFNVYQWIVNKYMEELFICVF